MMNHYQNWNQNNAWGKNRAEQSKAEWDGEMALHV